MGFSDLISGVNEVIRDCLGGDLAAYASGSGSPVEVDGIFDDPARLVDTGAHPGVSLSGPSYFCLLADLGSDPETDSAPTLTIAGVVYSIREVQKDGKGGVRLLLLRVV